METLASEAPVVAVAGLEALAREMGPRGETGPPSKTHRHGKVK